MLNRLFLLLLITIFSSGCEDRSIPEATITFDGPPPNFLFILTDDQGIGDLSLHGNDSIRTPNTDQLLRESVRFSRFYVNPVCAPTRAAFLSGQYAQRTGALFVTRRAETMSDSITTIAELLTDNGYRTGLFGKWHNGATYPYNPAGQGFQEFLGFSMGHYNSYYDYHLENESGERVPFQGYLTDVLTDTAVAFMQENSKDPFFCMLTYQAPHTPVQGPDSLFNYYKSLGLTDYNAGIYAMIEANDHAIGRLLEELETTGKLDNTIVIFSTDNGPNGDRYRMGLRGTKGHVDEGGVRVPFGIRLGNYGYRILRSRLLSGRSNAIEKPSAGVGPEGKIVSTPAANIDLLPTVAALANIKFPDQFQPLDGRSLLPLLFDDTAKENWEDRNLYTIKQGLPYRNYPGGFRNERYLYILRTQDQHELYDLQQDPGQQNDIFDPNDRNHMKMAAEYAEFTADLVRNDRVAPPIQIGHEAVRELRLLAHEGEPYGRAKFHDKYGWANDWAEDISVRTDGIRWPVKVIQAGSYRYEIEYATWLHKSPLLLSVTAGKNASTIEAPIFDNEDLPTRDLVRRKEVYPRKWATVSGTLQLDKTVEEISVSPRINGKGNLLVKSVVLKRQ